MSTQWLLAASLLAATLAACQGCKDPTTPNGNGTTEVPTTPSVRLYVSSTIAGALEPCGCSKDQLGGIDHLAAFVASEKAAAPQSAFVTAGPMLFLDAEATEEQRQQNLWKAESIAQAAKTLSLAAWAPGLNDWAGGSEWLGKMATTTGAPLLAGNLSGIPGAQGVVVREFGGLKVAFIGVADPKDRVGRTPEGVTAGPAEEALKKGLEDGKKQGARVFVGVAAMQRGQALRLADLFPELNVLVVGKPAEAGEGNDAPKPPQIIGTTLVVETSNHLQTVAVVDLFVAPGSGDGPLTFGDAGGVAKAEELLSLSTRIRDLEIRINGWEGDKNVKPEDLSARRADLEKLRADKAKLEQTSTPVSGSAFKYRLVEIRNELGSEAQVKAAMTAYYKRVNDHNKTAFADRKPRPAPDGKASYIGIEACSACHEEERKVYDATKHAHAYETLQKDFKEYNLDCVSCHVTGYDKPGGSTVTQNTKLLGVQCEECHGPGSLHAKDPDKKGLIVLKPAPETCVNSCHHPPHVEGFDPSAKVKLILGPGHGM